MPTCMVDDRKKFLLEAHKKAFEHRERDRHCRAATRSGTEPEHGAGARSRESLA